MTKTVLEKMLYKPTFDALVLHAPPELSLEGLGKTASGPGPYDWILAFVKSEAELKALTPKLLELYRKGSALWIAYPKASGTIKTDIGRDKGWEALEALGLWRVTLVALDQDWSALRFRYRDEIKVMRRKQTPPSA